MEDELFEELRTKADRMKEYLTAFQKWQRENWFFTRSEEPLWDDDDDVLPWEEDEEESEPKYKIPWYLLRKNRKKRVRKFHFCRIPVRRFHRNIKNQSMFM